MKAYYVYVDKVGYDEYSGFVVVAANETNALEMVKDKFHEWQGEIHVEEVDMTKEHVVLDSFCAG